MADENELDRLAGLRPGEPPHPGPGWHDEDAPRIGRPRMISDVLGYPAEVGDAAYTELARLRAAGDPERDARREAYRDRERRRASRALDRYMEVFFTATNPDGIPKPGQALVVLDAGERFVEAVGDYVLSRLGERMCGNCGMPRGTNAGSCDECTASGLQQNRHYDASSPDDHTTECNDRTDGLCSCGIKPDHRNPDSGRLFGADAHGGLPGMVGFRRLPACDWPEVACTGHRSPGNLRPRCGR